MAIDPLKSDRLPAWLPIALGVLTATIFAVAFAAPALNEAERFERERADIELRLRSLHGQRAAIRSLVQERERLREAITASGPSLDSDTLSLFTSDGDGLLRLRTCGTFEELSELLLRVDAGRALKVRELIIEQDDGVPNELVLSLAIEPIFVDLPSRAGADGSEDRP